MIIECYTSGIKSTLIERKEFMMKGSTQLKPKKMPHTYVLLFSIMIVMMILTYIVPAGSYDRYVDEATGRTLVDPSSFHRVEQTPVTPFGLFKAVPQGMNAAANITFFIFVVAGAFQIITATGAVNEGILKVAKSFKGKEHFVIPIFMILFSLTGAFLGFSEENIIFVPVMIALARALGYDALVGMSIMTIGGNCGFNAAMTNPFTVGVAQGIAELPLFSGVWLRFIVWVVLLIVSITFVLRYGKRVQKDPTKSLVYDLELEEASEKSIDIDIEADFTGKHKIIFVILLLGFASILFGVYQWDWGIIEISAAFLIMGVIGGFIGGMGPSKIATEFVNGCRTIIFGALVVGVARGILVILQNGSILDTIIYNLASVISILPNYLASVGMYFIQVVINFFIPSGSGQAAATMPIMVPLSDLVGVTRQTAVLAYQFGDGFTNIIIPTASSLMATLSLAHISYDRWVKYLWKLMVIWVSVGAIFMIIASLINYGPF